MGELRRHIIEQLVRQKLLTISQVEEAFTIYKQQKGRLSSLLLERQYISRQVLSDFLKGYFQCEPPSSLQSPASSEITAHFPPQLCREYQMVPCAQEGDVLTVAFVDPLVLLDIESLPGLASLTIKPVFVSEEEFVRFMTVFSPTEGQDAQAQKETVKQTAEPSEDKEGPKSSPSVSQGQENIEEKEEAESKKEDQQVSPQDTVPPDSSQEPPVPTPPVKKPVTPEAVSTFAQTRSMEEILQSVSRIPSDYAGKIELSELAEITQEAPVVKATNFILDQAIESKASDVLIEPLETKSRIRLRIDGIFHQSETLPFTFHPFIISRIKVLANLDISEHRLPQDGQFEITTKGRVVEFRVSVFPTINGEKAAIRILDKSLGLLDIDKLGIRPEALDKLKKAALLPHGMILVCGPTGSGKTTTLYSLLKYVHSPEKNIITVEDPVEYQIRGVNQVAVNLKMGLTFERCIRSILRQDPDIIMIGEIRDFETMDIGIKAALTGHLVLSTLHTTTAAGSVVRLIDMGVEPFLINASVISILSQRLARRLCAGCKEAIPSQPYFRGRGCKECLQTGYKGRILIPEVMYMTTKVRALVALKQVEESRIKQLARTEGMRTLREEGIELAKTGITSLEEVLRITPSD